MIVNIPVVGPVNVRVGKQWKRLESYEGRDGFRHRISPQLEIRRTKPPKIIITLKCKGDDVLIGSVAGITWSLATPEHFALTIFGTRKHMHFAAWCTAANMPETSTSIRKSYFQSVSEPENAESRWKPARFSRWLASTKRPQICAAEEC